MPGLVLERDTQEAQETQAERARLVRLCARLAGETDAAEDLAQEALLIAWRQQDRLRDPARRPQWLAGIARNLCQDWRRRRARTVETTSPETIDLAPDDLDLEVELERRDLAELLDRALGLLPSATRTVLSQRYLQELPQAQVALRLGLTESAVEARLHRGKLLLRRAFLTTLRDSALAYGLVRSEDGSWQPTRIWCPSCGERTLVGRFTEQGRLALHCIGCRAVARLGLSRNRWTESGWPSLFRGVHAFKPALNRVLQNVHQGFGTSIVGRTSRCFGCATAPPIEVTWEALTERWVAGARCHRCGQGLGYCSTDFLLLARPEGRQFWRDHPRVRPLPNQEIERDGQPAVLTRLQSVTDSASLTAIFHRDTFRVLFVDGD
jgi:RNA polymerase sigma factor (sigma-70 family)